MSAYITFDNIAKHYHRADVITRALDGASFCVEQGELAVILGPSGAGKTTALNILGGMDTATSGQLLVDGRDITACNRRQLVEYRRYDIGFVFQFYNLVPNLTALENIELANQMKKEMCIRDRNHTDDPCLHHSHMPLPSAHPPHLRTPHSPSVYRTGVPSPWYRHIPVSYTHLDVYKRQSASFSISGASILHGPHQVAKKSTSTSSSF